MCQDNRNNVDLVKEKVRDVLDTFVSHHSNMHAGDLTPWKSDLNGLAKSIANQKNWEGYYKTVFQEDENVRQYLFELCGARHKFSHRDGSKTTDFSDEDVFRVAHTATLLLDALHIDTSNVAIEEIFAIKRAYGSRLYGDHVSQRDNVTKSAAQQNTAEDSKRQTSMKEPMVDTANTEKESTDQASFEEDSLVKLSEPTREVAKPRTVEPTDRVEKKASSRDYINRRYVLDDDYMENAAEVVEREFLFYDTTIQEDIEEDTRENQAISDFNKIKRKSSDSQETHGHRDLEPKAKNEQTSENQPDAIQRIGVVVVSGIAVLAIVVIVLFRGILDAFSRVFNELMAGNLYAWLLLGTVLLAVLWIYKRWMEQQKSWWQKISFPKLRMPKSRRKSRRSLFGRRRKRWWQR